MTFKPRSEHRASHAASSRPELVDLHQVGRRLGWRSTKLRRAAHNGTLPQPHYRFGSIPIWHWPDLLTALRRRRSGLSDLVPAWEGLPAIDLLALQEVAKRISIPAPDLRSLIRTQRFPGPDYRFVGADAWLGSTVDSWQAERRTEVMSQSAIERAEAEHLKAWHRLLESSRTESGLTPPAADLIDRFDAISHRLDEISTALSGPEPPDNEPEPADGS